MKKIFYWIVAARIRTLPLSISGIIAGNSLAYTHNFSITIFLFCLFTSIGFQILSNFANDYGDGVKGTDNNNRLGPFRVFQMGLLSRKELKNGIIICALINLIFVFSLVFISFDVSTIFYILFFIFLGVLSIIAAIKYTIGKKAYGYSGYGDIFVFIFFGLVGVLGAYFLQVKQFSIEMLLIGSAIGFLSVGVLNLNNMRDIDNDRAYKKNTLIVKYGISFGKKYHFFLMITPFLLASIYFLLFNNILGNYLFLILIFPLFFHLRFIYYNKNPKKFDSQLKVVSLITFFFSILLFLPVLF